MLVYRTIKKDLLSQYQNHEKVKGSNINTILSARYFGISYNNHHYLYDVKYLHFFRDLIDAVDLKKQRFEDKQEHCVILAFEIPDSILKKFDGRGGYQFDNTEVTAVEYAIPEEKYKPEWFKSVVDDDEEKQYKRKNVDYSKIGFGFHGQTNKEIDDYIKEHIIEESVENS